MSLQIRVMSAQLSHDTELFSNMDPYCVLQLGAQQQRTKTRQEAGKKPVWNESFRFASTDNNLRVKVMDEDNVSDDLVGEGQVNVSKFRSSPTEQDQIVQLFYQGKTAGKVLLKISSGQGGNTMGQSSTNQWGISQQGGNQWGQQAPYVAPTNPYGVQPSPYVPQNPYGQPQPQPSYGVQPNPYGQVPQQPANTWGAQQNVPFNPYGGGQNVQPNPYQANNPQTNQWGNLSANNGWGNFITQNTQPNAPTQPNTEPNLYPELPDPNKPPANQPNPLTLLGGMLGSTGIPNNNIQAPNNGVVPPNNFNQPPNNFSQPPNNFNQPPNNGYTPPPNNGYTPPPNNGYTPPPNNGYTPPPSNPYGNPYGSGGNPYSTGGSNTQVPYQLVTGMQGLIRNQMSQQQNVPRNPYQ